MTRRLPKLRPNDLTFEQRNLYSEIAGGPRASGTQAFELTDADGRLNGPFNAMLFAPEVGKCLQELGSAIRYRTSLTGRMREMAILLVAAHWDSAFERHAHEAVGRMMGLDDEELAGLRDGRVPEGIADRERAAAEFVLALLNGGNITDAQFNVAAHHLDQRELMELSTLVGYYATLALQLRIFGVPVSG